MPLICVCASLKPVHAFCIHKTHKSHPMIISHIVFFSLAHWNSFFFLVLYKAIINERINSNNFIFNMTWMMVNWHPSLDLIHKQKHIIWNEYKGNFFGRFSIHRTHSNANHDQIINCFRKPKKKKKNNKRPIDKYHLEVKEFAHFAHFGVK